MGASFPGASAQYRHARDRLLAQEAELRRVTEAVAAARRDLPPGGAVGTDYVFRGPGADGHRPTCGCQSCSRRGKDTLVIYNMMFPRAPDEDLPCPSCTQFLDSFDGVALHAAQRMSLAVVAKTDLPKLLAHGERRGWRHLRLLSSAGNTFNRDYHGEDADGSQAPMMNVFQRDGGTIRHFWGSELLYAPSEPGQDPRHSDSVDALWNVFDLTPGGRSDEWYPDLSYG